MMKTHYDIFRTAALAFTAAALAFGCAKESEPEEQAPSQAPSGERYELTVEVAGDPATKTVIAGPNAENKLPVTWASGDKLYVVGATDGYLGCLEMTGSAGAKTSFKGTVSGWTSTQTLHIYYLGTDDPGLAAKAGEFTFSIGTQEGTLEWIASKGHISHYATTETYAPGCHTVGTDEAPVSMENLNAVVLFDLSQWSAGTTISGTYSSAKLNLKTGAFSTKTEGNITLAAEKCTGSTYVSFIPDTTALTFTQGTYSTPAMTNGFAAGSFSSNNGTAIDMPRLENDGALPGTFTVDAYGTKVQFSRGNLQATCTKAGTETTSEYSWGFAENQYDVIGNAEGNTTIASQTVGKKVDLFCWVGKSSSKLTGAATKYGITESTTYSDYGDQSTTETLMDDWGNIATLPGNTKSQKIWRTLTGGSNGEWDYLLSKRAASTINGTANARYAVVKVNEIVGILLFPDVFTWPSDVTTIPTLFNDPEKADNPNPNFTVGEFSKLQTAGCVFLPTNGYRHGNTVNQTYDGFYQSSILHTSNVPYRIAFGFYEVYPVQDGDVSRACSVRLVREVETEIPEGALSGKFAVSATKRVRFSKGNLYYDGSSFKFEENQYSYQSTYVSTHVSHFLWAKKTSNLSSDITSAISTNTSSVTGTSSNVFFTNSTKTTSRTDFTVESENGKWRTLSKDEWTYLLKTRSGSEAPDINGNTDCRYAEVKVNNICGMLIFPCSFTWPSSVSLIPSTFNKNESNWNSVDYTLAQFTLLESAGCVFLPTAGRRDGTSMQNVGENGAYWSSSDSSTDYDYTADFLLFTKDEVSTKNYNRNQGRAVRLVTDAE